MASVNSNLIRVFVYGTLKRNQPNHYLMNDVKNGIARFLGTAETLDRLPLVIASRYNIPFLLGKVGVGNNVLGEMYEVDAQMLGVLDELEGHPDYYTRTEQTVCVKSIGDAVTIEGFVENSQQIFWIYILKTFRSDLLNLPMLNAYETDGDHGLPYVERYKRNTDLGYSVYNWARGME